MSLHTKRAVWADDDCKGVLRFLGRSLSRRGVSLRKFESWSQAHSFLMQECKSKEASKLSLLVDIILPRSVDGEALDPYLGLELAQLAASCGVLRICFLTVIPLEEIRDRYLRLKDDFESTMFLYEDKLELLDEGKIASIVEFLTGENDRGDHA